uniref:Uncharacterized protein n=1 Tax=Rhizophora mucronata TaxID=61149 RepID=A0A2P2PBH9_RHIMU
MNSDNHLVLLTVLILAKDGEIRAFNVDGISLLTFLLGSAANLRCIPCFSCFSWMPHV